MDFLIKAYLLSECQFSFPSLNTSTRGIFLLRFLGKIIGKLQLILSLPLWQTTSRRRRTPKTSLVLLDYWLFKKIENSNIWCKIPIDTKIILLKNTTLDTDGYRSIDDSTKLASMQNSYYRMELVNNIEQAYNEIDFIYSQPR